MNGEIEKLGKKELRDRLGAEIRKNGELSDKNGELLERIGELQDQMEELLDESNNEIMKIDDAGSLAEAALSLSGVFTAADDAVSWYVENVKTLNSRLETEFAARDEAAKKKAEETVADARRRADALLAEAMDRSKKMLADAAEKSEGLLLAAKGRADDYYAETKRRADAYVKARTDLLETVSKADEILS